MARSRSRGAHAASHRAPRSGQLAGRAKLGRAMAGRLVPRRPAPKGGPAPAAGYATEQIAGDQVTELPATGIPATETPAAGLPVTGIPVAGTGDEAARRPARLSRVRSRVTLVRVAAIVCALAVLSFGLVEGGGAPSPSAEPTVQAFLLAWERGQYSAAAALTTGGQAEVAQQPVPDLPAAGRGRPVPEHGRHQPARGGGQRPLQRLVRPGPGRAAVGVPGPLHAPPARLGLEDPVESRRDRAGPERKATGSRC